MTFDVDVRVDEGECVGCCLDFGQTSLVGLEKQPEKRNYTVSTYVEQNLYSILVELQVLQGEATQPI